MKTIGYFLGATFGAAVVFYLISFIFFKPRDVEESEVLEFIKKSEKILISKVPLKEGGFYGIDERLGTNIISKTTYFSNRNMSYIRGDTYLYFSTELNKYVQTTVISEGGYVNREILKFGDSEKDKNVPDIIFYYNKIQNEDPSYGTIDKPLPILHFRSANPALKSMRKDNKDADEAYLKKVYEENVKLYLQYFIDKEDFKKLFPKE